MASSSTSYSAIPPNAPSMDYSPYPPPLATYEEVVASPQRFRQTLEQLHASMGTKFKVPTVGGRELDLYRLFVEVTSRGGFLKVLQEKKWREVTNVFNFPASATNASYILRKYYNTLLCHYEQVYFFKAKGWSPNTVGLGAMQNVPDASSGPVKSSPAIQPATHLAPGGSSVKFSSGASSSSLTGSVVYGVIDGSFESGYLITMKVGDEECRGVLYEPLLPDEHQQPHEIIQQKRPINERMIGSGLVHRRKRRKKSEIRRRDPDHPKSNRSGYNFFFAEQHARLKPLYPGKDREISRMIGEAWNKLNEGERSKYQEQAAKDKERYIIEMESYKQRSRAVVQNSSNTVQIQQQPIQMVAEASGSQNVSLGAVYAVPVQTEPIMSNVSMVNSFDKSIRLPKNSQPLEETHGMIIMDQERNANNGDERLMDSSLMPIAVDAEMTAAENNGDNNDSLHMNASF